MPPIKLSRVVFVPPKQGKDGAKPVDTNLAKGNAREADIRMDLAEKLLQHIDDEQLLLADVLNQALELYLADRAGG